MKIATLGPEGTFSQEAVIKYNNKAIILLMDTIRNVFESVLNEKADFGIVPIENSIAGTVGQTQDCLFEYGLKIKAEEIIPISHNLVCTKKIKDIKDIKLIYLHQQTYEQCELFIKKNIPDAEIILTSSNGKSAEIVSKLKIKTKRKGDENVVAAIIPKTAATIYKLNILRKNVQDNKFNTTRFFIVGREENKQSGHDRTGIAIYPRIDRPGLLYDILSGFAKMKINLTKIESRPSKGRLGEYIFYIDFEGHKLERNIAEILKKLEETAVVKVLGSYPRKY